MPDKTLLFTKRSMAIYGDIYNYDKTEYIDSKSKITITCKIHGDFFQSAANHFRTGCSACSQEKAKFDRFNKVKQTFIDKVTVIHGDKYDLTNIEYQSAKAKIRVKCYDHGDFEITAQHFLAGSGCSECGKLNAIKINNLKKYNNFYENSKKIHDNKYDYSLVEYQTVDLKVTIVCPIHGQFFKTPRKHLDGQGCNLCEGKKIVNRITKESFIEKAMKVHGNNYDYSKTIFLKSHVKLTIICRKHGEFSQNPHNHLSGSGCKKCADDSLIKTSSQFEQEAHVIHKNKFDYSNLNYVDCKSKVNIVCPSHGPFSQMPTLHLSGSGCLKCSIEERAKKLASNTIEFIEIANGIHNYRWSYDKTDYNDNHTKVIITCDIHGDFQQTPASHKSGRGCPVCGSEKSIDKRTLSVDDFVLISSDIHQFKYNYKLVDYKNNNTKLSIICPIHGVFEQRPYSHMKGSGCAECSYEKRKMTFNEFVLKANDLHDKTYSYTNSNSIDSNGNVIISCHKHGDFSQRASTHLMGAGCKQCGQEIAGFNRRIKTNEFLERANLIHDNKYIYSGVSCDGVDQDIEIYCPSHGPFTQKVSQHLRGSGCRGCYVDSTRLSQHDFINDCRLRHESKYDYSLVEYTTIRDKIIIICNLHGAFIQTAHDHKHGAGCPICAEYERNLGNKEPDAPCYLYYLKLKYNDLVFYKIGITTRSVEQRFNTIVSDGVIIEDEFSVLTTIHKAITAEQQILLEFSNHLLYMNHILIKTRGGTECFADDVMGIYDISPKDFIQ